MILLQNPNIPVATNPVEIDAAIIDILSELNTNLTWLDNGYGRAYKNADARNGGILFFPEVYLGTQNNSQRYLNVTPDNDKGGSCFFFVSRETITEFQTGQYGFLNYQMAIIFSCNMELIQSTLLSTEYYQQNLIAEVRNVLSRQLLGKNYQLTLQSVEYLVENVFAEFDIQNTNEVEKAPFTHFRVNCSVVLPEQCPVPTLLPVLDCKSIDLDGVNEYLGYGIYPTPLPSNTNFLFSKTEQFSFSIWFKIDSFTGSQVGLIATGNFSVQLGYQVNLNSSSGQAIFILTSGVFTSVQGSFTKQSADAIVSGQYNNIICTYNGDSDINNMKIYVNGIDSGYSSVTDNGLTGDISYPTTPLKIFRGKGTGTTNGKLNNVRIWRGVALNPSQALAEYNSGVPMFTAIESANLVLDLDIQNADWDGSQYNFPNKTGITNDLIGYNTEEADLINECPGALPVLDCKSMDLDGVNEYMAYGVYPNPFTGNNAFDFEYTNAFTLSLWVKFDTIGISQPLINKYKLGINKGYFFLLSNKNEVRFGLQSQSGQIFEIKTPINTITSGVFYHIVATYDGSNTIGGLNMYINGNLANFNQIFNQPLISTLIDSNQPLEIGRLSTTFGYLNGLISKVRIWNTELSAGEVTTEYNSGVINPSAVQSGSLVLDADIPNATFLTADPTYGTGYLINNKVDDSKFFTYNSEVEDLVDGCPE